MTYSLVRSHPLRAFTVALATVTVLLLAAAPRASAEIGPICNPISTSNACLRLDRSSFTSWRVRASIDVFMSAERAREIIRCGADMKAALWGDDGGSEDDLIRTLALVPGWPAVTDVGLGAEFVQPFIGVGEVDEDPGTESDELYVRIGYYDCRADRRRHFRTGTITGLFH